MVEDFLQANFSSPTHWPDWNLVVSKYYGSDFFYLALYEEGELNGICPMHTEKRGLLTDYRSGHFRFIPYGGWIFSKKFRTDYKLMSNLSLSRYEVMELPLLPEFKNDLANHNDNMKKTLVVDLSQDIDVIWEKQLNYRRRRGVRKAQKSNVTTEYGIEYFDSFYNLYQKATTRLGLTLMPKYLLKELLEKSRNIGFEVITAKLEGRCLANLVVPYDKNYSFYWLGNSANNAPNLGQNELLHWEVMKRMKEKGCKYYDLCIIDKDKYPGIYEFKSGFSKYEVDVPITSSKPLSYKIINRLTKMF